jgi:hypothetical protein
LIKCIQHIAFLKSSIANKRQAERAWAVWRRHCLLPSVIAKVQSAGKISLSTKDTSLGNIEDGYLGIELRVGAVDSAAAHAIGLSICAAYQMADAQLPLKLGNSLPQPEKAHIWPGKRRHFASEKSCIC